MTDLERELILKIVKLGQLVRQMQAEGRLQSVPPPTLYGYMTFLRLAAGLQHIPPELIARVTVLGHASPEDSKIVPGLLNQVFGLQPEETQDDRTLSRSAI